MSMTFGGIYMPRYDYECSKCGHIEEVYQSFHDEPLKKCPSCKKNKFHRIITSVNFTIKGEPTTLGQLAEKNTKKMGKELVQLADEKAKIKKPKPKKQWYGKLPDNKKKDILSSKERAKKYILTGE